MTELLTKEKEFIKLNQQLDRMALSADTGYEVDNNNKFYTYQKSKGPSTLLRKQGAGDGIAEIADFTNVKEARTNTLVNKVAGGETYRSCQSTHPSNLPQYRPKQQTKCSDTSRSQTYNRVSSCRVVPSNNSAFTVKYRNSKFLESPSLEMLVREESTALRNQTEASRIGSVSSLAKEDVSATGRCSQTTNHTVASKRNISSEGLIKFLKSKIIILEEDHERISDEMAKQKNVLDKALEYTRGLEQQRDQAKNKNYALTEQLAKIEKQLNEANKRLKDRSIEQNMQYKELETIKRELKLLTQANTNLEKRLYRANEELDSAHNTLSLMKTHEREHKESTKKESETKESQIKSLKKQRSNLLNAYKKQLFLIDNLKRQNILLEQAKMMDIGEKEFAKVLDWDFKKS